MANKKISELDDLSTVTSDDLAVVVDISTLSTRKASMANLKSYFQQDIAVPHCEIITLSPMHLINKSVTLTNAPKMGYNVTVTPHGGPPQFLGKDFIVSDDSLIWLNLELDGLLEVGDIIKVDYFY